MKKTTALLIVDAQYDFCHPEGALYVPGAEQDALRIAALIRQHASQIDQVVLTLDTHHIMNIAHPVFWEDEAGKAPPPFTPITAADVDAGRWIPRYEAAYAREYVYTLEAQGEFQHFIWPEHCLIGTRGAALDDTIVGAVRAWVHRNGRDYEVVVKGVNPFAEHFGVFRAQVPIPGSPETELNTSLITLLERYDQVLLAGEARSHCVGTSLKQILRYAPELVPNVVVLTDCMSDVAGFGHLADSIFAEAHDRGVQFTTSTEVGF